MSVRESHPSRTGLLDPTAAERLIAERKRLGLDRWDEAWDDELHMGPPPSAEHGRIEVELTIFLGALVKERRLGAIVKAGVREPGAGERNYRVPDLAFVASERASIMGEWIEGGPDLVFEIRSPGDEAYEKLPFYAALGVREVVVIDRDTKRVEIFRPAGGRMLPVNSAADGSLVSEPLGIVLRRLERPDGAGALEVSDGRDPARRTEI